jgi:hypothetical protein
MNVVEAGGRAQNAEQQKKEGGWGYALIPKYRHVWYSNDDKSDTICFLFSNFWPGF